MQQLLARADTADGRARCSHSNISCKMIGWTQLCELKDNEQLEQMVAKKWQ